MVLIDSYDVIFGFDWTLQNLHPSATTLDSACGQHFHASQGYKITSSKFYLKKFGSPEGEMKAGIWEVDPSTGLPTTAAPKAASINTILLRTLTTSYVLKTFTFGYYEIVSGRYFAGVYISAKTTVDGSNYVCFGQTGGMGGTDPDANLCNYHSSQWYSQIASLDGIFYVYGDVVSVAGKPCMIDGLVCIA